jgi:hypothetical protein
MADRTKPANPYIASRIPDDGKGTCAARSYPALRAQAQGWAAGSPAVPLLCGDKAGTSPLLCGDKPPAVRGQAPCCAGTSPLLCGDEHRAGAMKNEWGSESVTPPPFFCCVKRKFRRSRPSQRRDRGILGYKVSYSALIEFLIPNTM